ncbi:hypothetical protein MXB_3526, partial [Myxobolus squamalis]
DIDQVIQNNIQGGYILEYLSDQTNRIRREIIRDKSKFVREIIETPAAINSHSLAHRTENLKISPDPKDC